MTARGSSETEGCDPGSDIQLDKMQQAASRCFLRRKGPGNLQTARQLYERLAPFRPVVLNRLAQVCALLGDWGTALRIWRDSYGVLWADRERGLEGLDRHALDAAHRVDPALFEVADLADVLQNSVSQCEAAFKGMGFGVRLQAHSAPLHISCSARNLQRAFLALLENAFEAICVQTMTDLESNRRALASCGYGPYATLTANVRRVVEVSVTQADAGHLQASVLDRGIGLPRPWLIPDDALAELVPRRKHLTDGSGEATREFIHATCPLDDGELEVWMATPGWTTKGKGYQRTRAPLENGPGMGVYMARQILWSHGGTLQYHRAEGGGTMATATLPFHRS